MKKIAEQDAISAIAQAVIGASESIEIGISPLHPEWIRYVRDTASMGDSRLDRRMILPGYDSDLSSSMTKRTHTPLIADVRSFLQQDWEVKTSHYSRLGFAIMIDREIAFHSFPSQERDPVRMAVARPEFSIREGQRELSELIWQFDHGWNAGVIFETVYREAVEDDEGEDQLTRTIRFSDKQFKDLLKHFSKYPEKMRQMNPHEFEEFVAGMFEKEGFKVELAKFTRDGGRDILVTSETSLGKHLHLVDCKRYAEHRRVDVTLIRSLYGVVEKERATAGMIITTTQFTKDALKEVDDLKNRMAKKDYNDLKKWIDTMWKA